MYPGIEKKAPKFLNQILSCQVHSFSILVYFRLLILQIAVRNVCFGGGRITNPSCTFTAALNLAWVSYLVTQCNERPGNWSCYISHSHRLSPCWLPQYDFFCQHFIIGKKKFCQNHQNGGREKNNCHCMAIVGGCDSTRSLNNLWKRVFCNVTDRQTDGQTYKLTQQLDDWICPVGRFSENTVMINLSGTNLTNSGDQYNEGWGDVS